MGRDCVTASQAIGRVCPPSRRQRPPASGSRLPRLEGLTVVMSTSRHLLVVQRSSNLVEAL